MSLRSFEIRICRVCGLRYPLIDGNSFGLRCPHCLADTSVVLEQNFSEGTTRESTGSMTAPPRRHVLLDNLRSAWNTGSILRTAEGFGFEHAYLGGITPTPEQEAVQKTSLGAEDTVSWSYHKDAVKLVTGLKKQGWTVVALEENERALSVRSISRARFPNIVLILGNEVTGVDQGLLDLAESIIYIPMKGRKRSFNVAIAFAIAASQISD